MKRVKIVRRIVKEHFEVNSDLRGCVYRARAKDGSRRLGWSWVVFRTGPFGGMDMPGGYARLKSDAVRAVKRLLRAWGQP